MGPLMKSGLFLFFITFATVFAQDKSLELEACHLSGSSGTQRLAAECGWLTVPEDPDNPSGKTIDLFVAKVPARAKKAEADPITFIAGGPGQASTTSFVDLSGAFHRLRFERDIVLVDQRGTGKSNPLTCAEPPEIDEYDAQAIRDLTSRCLAQLSGDPRFYTTSVAVRDLDLVRQALNVEQLNLYGISYGTRVALHYLRQYPEHTRSVIVDGVAPPSLNLGPGIALDAQSAMNQMFARCKADEVCNKNFPDLDKGFGRIEKRLENDSLMLSLADPVSGKLETTRFGADEFALAMRLLSYSPETLAIVPLLLQQAYHDDNYQPLAAQAAMVGQALSESIAGGMHNAVVCSEDVPFYDDSEYSTSDIRQTYLGLTTLDGLINSCDVWPQGMVDDNFKDAVVSDKPVLLLSGEADPVTPPRYAIEAATTLVNHKHLQGKGQGHGMASIGCMPKLMAEFLSTASFDEWDTSCVDITEPAPFFTSFNGPEP